MALTPVNATVSTLTFTPSAPAGDPTWAVAPQVVQHTVSFDWTPLLALGNAAQLHYITCNVAINAHDTTAFQSIVPLFTPSGSFGAWFEAELLLSDDFASLSTSGPNECGGCGTFAPVCTFPYDTHFAPGHIGSPAGGYAAVLDCFNYPNFNALTFNIECDFQNECGGAQKYFTFATAPTVTLSNIKAWVQMSGAACAPCVGGAVTIPSGHCAGVCLSSQFVNCAGAPTVATITGPIAGCTIQSRTGCTATICTPCLTQAQVDAGGFAGPYTVTIPGVDVCTGKCEVLTGTFMMSQGVICTAPPGGAAAAIEADGPRQWVHVGRNNRITTYDNAYNPLFMGTYPGVDEWRKLRADPRTGSLVALGRTFAHNPDGSIIASTSAMYSIWHSLDGGGSANKVASMSATSSTLERDSERNWLLWFTADDTNQVSVQVSLDGGQTFAAAQDVHDDKGARLQAALQDTCQDCRSGGRVALVCALGPDPAVVGTPAVLVSDDGGLTFRRVV